MPSFFSIEMGLTNFTFNFAQVVVEPQILPVSASHIAGMTGMLHHTQLLAEMGLVNFLLRLA
jgi:hypothetical protein